MKGNSYEHIAELREKNNVLRRYVDRSNFIGAIGWAAFIITMIVDIVTSVPG